MKSRPYHLSKRAIAQSRLTGDVVEIIRVLHERMDIEQRLSSLLDERGKIG